MKRIRSVLLLLCFLSTLISKAQLPANTLVGYHENWRSLKLTDAHPNYNVICLAFALPKNFPSVGYDIKYDLPSGYTKASFMADIDVLHSQGKKVILSIGGATGPIFLANDAQRDVFVSSVTNILAEYNYKIDGIDIDFESSSFDFPSTWTISNPAAAQTRVVDAVKTIMSNYKTATGKKCLLLMAPEVVYLHGGMSNWQVDNVNGGAFLPIINGLRNELDLLCMQLYNAGGASGGVFGWDGKLYYDNGGIDFALAMNETVIKGFTCVRGKGTFAGLPASKLAFGFPASTSTQAAGTGYVTPDNICKAAKYFKGEISKPSGVSYNVTRAYPELKGLMTWSINEDSYSTSGVWSFANGYPCAFPEQTGVAPIANFNISKTTINVGEQVTFTDASVNNPTSWTWNFGSGASLNSSSSSGPHNITYSTSGNKVISLTVANSNGTSALVNKTITVNQIINNVTPLVNITSPSNSSTFTVGTSVNVTANATDSDGQISKVEFLVNGQKVGEDNTAPYAYNVQNLNVGNYVLTVKATDNDGAFTTSSAVNITINEDVIIGGCNEPVYLSSSVYVAGNIVSFQNRTWKAKWWTQGSQPGTTGQYGVWEDLGPCQSNNTNVAPAVSITSPSNGATFDEGSTVNVTANATDSDGQVSKVEFLVNGQQVATDVSAPYVYNAQNLSPGSYTLTAIATDNDGATTTSSVINITVNQVVVVVNNPPTVSITSPSNGATFDEGSTVNVNASATDNDGQVSKVDFLVNGQQVATDVSAPYVYNAQNLSPGSYILTAIATDNDGATTTSSVINIIVNEVVVVVNNPPTVSITSPSNGTSFDNGATVNVTANAADNDGQVSKLTFVLNGQQVNEDLSAPYAYSIQSLTAGNYNLTAIAIDNEGASTTSSSVSFTIKEEVVINNCNAPAYSSGNIYVGGDIVSHQNRIWKAKWWTQGSQPGTTGQWGVWEDLGSCSQPEGNSFKAFAFTNESTTNLDIESTENQSYTIQVFSMSGQVVHTGVQQGTALDVVRYTIDNNTWKNGFYTIVISSEKETQTIKIIK